MQIVLNKMLYFEIYPLFIIQNYPKVYGENLELEVDYKS